LLHGIRQVVAAGIPYFGVCLGGQLLAAALGAKVVAKRWEEIGNFQATLTEEGVKDRLFNAIPKRFPVFQWHHDSFDIPAGGVLLAASDACPHQAFRVGDSAWGVQFHPEVTEEIIRCWCGWDSATAATVESMVANFYREEQLYRSISQRLIGNFAQIPCHFSGHCRSAVYSTRSTLSAKVNSNPARG
jgi:GMP synthase-like glutamine amidotransferase